MFFKLIKVGHQYLSFIRYHIYFQHIFCIKSEFHATKHNGNLLKQPSYELTPLLHAFGLELTKFKLVVDEN
jgi:hypothetical protein